MATCSVIGQIVDEAGVAIENASVRARTLRETVVGNAFVSPTEVAATTDASGNFTLTVQQSLSVLFVVDFPMGTGEPRRSLSYSGTIPATASASFTSIIIVE